MGTWRQPLQKSPARSGHTSVGTPISNVRCHTLGRPRPGAALTLTHTATVRRQLLVVEEIAGSASSTITSSAGRTGS
jgi:hypothetical protein